MVCACTKQKDLFTSCPLRSLFIIKCSLLLSIPIQTGSRWHFTLKWQSIPIWHTGQLNLGFYHSSLHSYPVFKLLFSILLYRLSIDWDMPGTRTPPPIFRNGRLKQSLALLTMGKGVPPEVYRSRSNVEPTQVNTGHIFKDSDQDAHLHHQTEKSWQGPHPHGATAVPAADPPGMIPLENTTYTPARDLVLYRPSGWHGLAALS